jgi:soluble lytic murein transglycosylase
MEFSMAKSIPNPSIKTNRKKKAVTTLPAALLMLSFIMPATVSCQRTQGDRNRGINELRSLVESADGRPAIADLQRIESRYPETRAASLAQFLRGYLHHAGQNYTAAIDAFNARTISEYTSLGDYAYFLRAESQAATNLKGEALRDYGIVYTKHPDSLKAREAKLGAARMALALGDPQSAMKELREMIEAKDADALYIAAQIQEATGKTEEAIRAYRRIYFYTPATKAAVDAEAKLAALGSPVKDSPGTFEELRARSDALYEAKQYSEAVKTFDEMAARFPESEQVDEIQLRRGTSQLNARMPAQAVTSLARVTDSNPALKAEALFNQAEALRRSNRAGESGVIVDRLVRQYSTNRLAHEALYDLAKDSDRQGRKSEAAARFRQLLNTFPASQYAAEAAYYTGWQAYLARNYAEAARALQQNLANYRAPENKFIGEAGFWAARAEERLGNKARALALYDVVVERYRYGYHGYLAARRAAAMRASDGALKPEQARQGSELERIRQNALYVEPLKETADGSEAPRVTRADELELIGLDELAMRELNKAIEAAPTSPRLNVRLAQLYSRRGDNFQATLIVRRGYPDIYSYKDSEIPREAWEIMFPLNNWETIKQEAKKYGIDPYLAAGLIRQESVFNPTAISRVGARGLMQVMPATGQMISRGQGNGRITAADLYNPTLNIKLGMNYLAQMLGQFQGRIEYAAAGYNAGPGRARQWLAARGSLDIEEWVETIPFTETRGYVMGVLRYAANYRRFYKE